MSLKKSKPTKLWLGKLYQYLNLIKHNLITAGLGHTSYCKHTPSCSRYTANQIEKHGALKGCAKGLKRVLTCY